MVSEAALLHLLSRAATVSQFLTPHYAGSPFSANTSDTIRLLKSTGARYAGRAAFVWGGEQQVPAMLPHVKATAALVHAACPDIVLEGGVFEIVTKAGVEQITIPAFVLEAFGLPAVPRTFNYAAMFAPGWKFLDHWGKDSSVPDLTQARHPRRVPVSAARALKEVR